MWCFSRRLTCSPVFSVYIVIYVIMSLQYYVDGGFSGMQPVMPVSFSNTLTVSPFSGETDICPSDTPCIWDMVVSGSTLKGNMANSFRVINALYPMALEVSPTVSITGCNTLSGRCWFIIVDQGHLCNNNTEKKTFNDICMSLSLQTLDQAYYSGYKDTMDFLLRSGWSKYCEKLKTQDTSLT